jgi:hypothetical protein
MINFEFYKTQSACGVDGDLEESPVQLIGGKYPVKLPLCLLYLVKTEFLFNSWCYNTRM